MKLLTNFEAEELLGEIVEWWYEIEMRIPDGQTVEKPRFVTLTERYVSRLPGTGPCQRGD